MNLRPGLYNSKNVIIKTWEKLKVMGLKLDADYPEIEDNDFHKYTSNTGSLYAVFKNNDLSGRLVLPETLVRIGDNAISGCKTLTALFLSNSIVSIGENFCANCRNLSGIYVPEKTISTIFPLRHCYNLGTIVINAQNNHYLADKNVVYNKNKTELIYFAPARHCDKEIFVVPKTVKTIGENAFEDCSTIKEIFIPRTVKEIKPSALRCCVSLERIYIYPETLELNPKFHEEFYDRILPLSQELLLSQGKNRKQ